MTTYADLDLRLDDPNPKFSHDLKIYISQPDILG
jgi:hypothetical protein